MMMPKKVSLISVKSEARPEIIKWADHLPETYLECRDLSHDPRPFTAKWFPKERVYVRVLKCSRCKTLRTQTLSETGHVLSSHYGYEQGYLAPPGTGRLTSDDRARIRLITVLKQLEG
jgi:hypothetical protein